MHSFRHAISFGTVVALFLPLVPLSGQTACQSLLRRVTRATVMNGLDPDAPRLLNVRPRAISIAGFKSITIPPTTPPPAARLSLETEVFQLQGRLCSTSLDTGHGVLSGRVATDCRNALQAVTFFVPIPSICGSSSPLAPEFLRVHQKLSAAPVGRSIVVTGPAFIRGNVAEIGPVFFLTVGEDAGGGGGGGGSATGTVPPIGGFPPGVTPGTSPGSGPPAPPTPPRVTLTLGQPATLDGEITAAEWAVAPAGTIVIPVNVSAAGFTERIELSAISTADEYEQFAMSFTPEMLEPTGGTSELRIMAGPMAFAQPHYVTVTASAGDLVSRASIAVQVICDPPFILGVDQPSPVAAPAGSTVTFTAKSLGTGPFTYQWYRGHTRMTGRPVEGAYTSKLTVVASNSESYWVRISNACGSADSNAALLTVTPGTPQAKRRAG